MLEYRADSGFGGRVWWILVANCGLETFGTVEIYEIFFIAGSIDSLFGTDKVYMCKQGTAWYYVSFGK